MKNNIFLVFVIVLLGGCQKSQDDGFKNVVQFIEENEKVHFLYEALKAEPVHKFTAIELFQKKDTISSMNYYQNLQDDLADFFPSRLNESNQVLLNTVSAFLRHKIYLLKIAEEGDPSIYSPISILKKNAKNEEQTNEEQFEKIIQGLEKIPQYFSEVKAVIKNPDKEQLQLAVKAFSNDYFFLKNDLPGLIRKPDILKDVQIDFSNKNQKAQIAIKDFLAFLNSHLFELGDNK